MIPNNNLSVLPFYHSLDEQNARRWWIYNRVYPLFTPAGFLLPFQIMRDHRMKFTKDDELIPDSQMNGYITMNGDVITTEDYDFGMSYFDVVGIRYVYFDVPKPFMTGVVAVAKNDDDETLAIFNPEFINNRFVGGWELPTGTTELIVQTYNPEYPETGDVYNALAEIAPVEEFKIYTKNGVLVYTLNPVDMGFSIVPFSGYDVIVFPGKLPVVPQMDNGQYYAKLSDGIQTWYSEMFTVVNDITPYLKIEWWDENDFVMDAGRIVYRDPLFKNVIYLDSEIAKPEYIFEEEGETRDGYFFPIKQISEKRYRFSFLASEYLLDVLRFVRMSDYVYITKNGKQYKVDTFLITPEWEKDGDVAAVNAEFDCNTVAKKVAPVPRLGLDGDFNEDFNNDYKIN